MGQVTLHGPQPVGKGTASAHADPNPEGICLQSYNIDKHLHTQTEHEVGIANLQRFQNRAPYVALLIDDL